MRRLTYEVEAKGQYYDVEDWKDAYDDFRRIDDRMDVRKLTNGRASSGLRDNVPFAFDGKRCPDSTESWALTQLHIFTLTH